MFVERAVGVDLLWQEALTGVKLSLLSSSVNKEMKYVAKREAK